MTEHHREGPALVRDDELTTQLRAIVAPPADASYWDGLEARILARIERGREERRWWALSERAYQFGLLAAGLTLIVAGSVFLRERALERRMAIRSVIETPAPAPQVWARRGLVPDRQATLRAVTDH
ncbi:MAG: hypothetical protein KF709_08365 [Gemmatimonadaceae bacterium]|nr:hypothetical protein [Gemmatimonadaceae bacterium]